MSELVTSVSGDSAAPPGEGHDDIGHIETRGADFIPLEERDSRPANLFWTFFSAEFNFSNYTVGGLAIVLGLGWWSSAIALLLGTLIGSVAVSFLALLGPHTGTNSPVTSGAFFGIRGRYLGSVMAWAISLGSNVLGIWPSGLALEYASKRLFGTPTGTGPLIVGMVITIIFASFFAIYGHATLVAAFKIVGPLNMALCVLFVILVSSHFKMHFAHQAYAYGSFAPTWVFVLTLGIFGPITYAPAVNDYARRLPPETPPKRIIAAVAGGIFVGIGLCLMFGVFVTLCFTSPGALFAQAFVGLSPFWLVVPLSIIALGGNSCGLGLNFYNMTLDLHSILWRISRVGNAIIVSIASAIVVYLTVIAWNGIDFVSAMASIFSAVAAPWVAVLLVGYFRSHNNYRVYDLHTFALAGRRGVYWFTNGFNPRAWLIWIVGSAAALTFSSTTLFEGPLSRATNGMDVSFGMGFVVGLILCLFIDCTSREVRTDAADESGVTAAGPKMAEEVGAGLP
jgi:purine-cytosine permease-like protein